MWSPISKKSISKEKKTTTWLIHVKEILGLKKHHASAYHTNSVTVNVSNLVISSNFALSVYLYLHCLHHGKQEADLNISLSQYLSNKLHQNISYYE